jgi:membrane-bound serine protease (ClpP class)
MQMKMSRHSSFRIAAVAAAVLLFIPSGVPLKGVAYGSDVGVRQDQTVPETDGPVFVIPITGMIDKALAMYIDRAVSDAENAGASTIIFHVDTFGGLVDAADVIRKAILASTIPTIAYIDRNAASAGALISYAADTIVMAPGASIGAATVVEGIGGDAAPDKYQSYMRGLMRATAEANGRDPKIAEAMVDQDLAIEGISEAGQVLTLSTKEALDLGVADKEALDLDTLLAEFGLSDRELVAHTTSTTERVLRFFGSPVVQSILMLMMLGGLYFELQTPGVGFPGLMALLGAALFFGPNYLTGLVESWEIVLFILGVVLLLLEIFVIPGFGVAGISGLTLVIVSLGVGLIGNVGLSFPTGAAITRAVWTMASTLLILVFGGVFLGRYMPRSSRFNRLILAPSLTSADGYTAADSRLELVGNTGVALTPLRPAGRANVQGDRLDVTTSGEFIEAGAGIRVVDVKGSRIEVRELAQLTDSPETSS